MGFLTRGIKMGRKGLEEHYKDGNKDGLFTSWYENGNKSLKEHYKGGNKDGVFYLLARKRK